MLTTYDASIPIFANTLLYEFITSPISNSRLAVRTAKVFSNGWRLRFVLQLMPDDNDGCNAVSIMGVIDSFDVPDESYMPFVDAFETKQYTIELIEKLQTEDVCEFILKYVKSF